MREAYEFAAAFIPGAIHIPLSDLANNPEAFPIHGPAVVYCAAGVRSATAIELWQKQGATDLANLVGGIQAHAMRGGSLTSDPAEAGDVGVVLNDGSSNGERHGGPFAK